MTDATAPRRRIEGVSALSRMRSTPAAPASAPAGAAGPAPAPEQLSAVPGSPDEAPVVAFEQGADSQGSRARLSGYTTSDFASLAKSTYKATAHLEDEASFSDFLQAAVDREIKRRQELYNDGRPFATSTSRLQAGRPLRS